MNKILLGFDVVILELILKDKWVGTYKKK
jgi:hypothetical protein